MQVDSYGRLKCEQIIQLIHTQGLKRWWVAEEAGVHKTTLRRWLSGRIGKVKHSHAQKLANVLTVPPAGIWEPLTVTKN